MVENGIPSAPTEGLPEGFLTPGQVLGDRYQIHSQLGRGGMGEVWRAFDLKLRVEVALKAMLPELFKNEKRRDLLRREVRAAREVVSPNVCRIFDLIEVDGRELVSMEYVDGGTLLSLLAEQGPLDLKEAQDIASQFLAGLEAIHQVGLVHRDVKPENIMITRAGRVVLMDFGLARQEDSGAGTVSGTPAYMAPEQAAGLKVDARADVYSAGVVLAEMVSPEGIKDHASRQSVWEGIRQEPARVPNSPWAPVLKRAVAKEPDQRQNSAHTLIRELEDVTLRVEGAEDLTPYPGLASFTEADAEYFFGREAEIEAVWRRLENAHLLAIVGPSGAGKTSFIGAGLVPNAQTGWAIVRCTPGNAAISSLARAMAREMAGDADAMELAVGFDDPEVAVELFSRWRCRQDEALLIVDQFEELFTQNAAEGQRRFTYLLNRLVLEADIRVLLSMRDDYLLRCHGHEGLTPLFSDLTPLRAPSGAALRRALVQPATKCGYRFEDDDLVGEMLAEVEGERGALPLLAFAISRLWEKRDRNNGLLTRQAYLDIGGVGGALARHAETTIDRIGAENLPIVREVFRNLVTAEGTRAVRGWDELLSIFSGSHGESPATVLGALIDARLLTSYEVRGGDEAPTRRVEIIHESLLENWPRFVRWQTQDADAVQLRDQLRQAARTWDEHDRTDDYLWAGKAYREFEVWREDYSGGLTELEERFAQAITSLARRKTRRRRLAIATGFVVLLGVLAVVTNFWRTSVQQTRRAEAQKLLALGQLELEGDPTAALAWARASLDVFDTREGRRFALRALANGPIARILSPDINARQPVFSPDGEWLAFEGVEKFVVFHRSGGPAVFREAFEPLGRERVWPFFGVESRRLTVLGMGQIRSYEVPGFSEIARERLAYSSERGLFFAKETAKGPVLVFRNRGAFEFELLRFGSSPKFLLRNESMFFADIDGSGEWAAGVQGGPRARHDVYLRSLVDTALPPRLVHSHDEPFADFTLHPDLEFIAIRGRDSGEISLWPLGVEVTKPIRSFDSRGLPNLWVFRQGPRVVAQGMYEGNPTAFVEDLRLPPEAEPRMLRSRVGAGSAHGIASTPDGRWFVGCAGEAVFWPYPESETLIFPEAGGTGRLSFTPDGRNLIIPKFPGRGLRIQPLEGGKVSRVVMRSLTCANAEIDPQGLFAVVSAGAPAVAVVPLDGSEPTFLEGFDESAYLFSVAYDPERDLVAGGCTRGPADQKVIRVWNLLDGSVRVLGPTEGAGDLYDGGYVQLEFLPDGSLLSLSSGQIRRWRLEGGSSEVLFDGGCEGMAVPTDGRTMVVGYEGGVIEVLDFTTNEVRQVEGFQGQSTAGAVSPDGELLAAGFSDGEVQIRRLSGGESHIFFGHDVPITSMAFSPDGTRLATGDRGGTVRVWAVPDFSRPPIHTLSKADLLAKLDEITNFRVVRDDESPTGWKTEFGPFPGWETVPEW